MEMELIPLLRMLRKEARSLRATFGVRFGVLSDKGERNLLHTCRIQIRKGLAIASSCTALMALSDPDTLEKTWILAPLGFERR